MKKLVYNTFLAMLLVAGITSCKKNNAVVDQEVVPPTAGEFLANTSAPLVYYVRSTPDVLKIPVAFTTVSGAQRTMQFTYTSPSGAKLGTQFNAPASITFAPNQVIDTFRLTGIFSGYPSASKIDTLIVRHTGNETRNMARDSVVIILRKYCDVVTSTLQGSYTQTNEYTSAGAFSYGPYSTSVNNVTLTSATTATATVSNLYDDGWNDIQVVFDWTNPAAFKVTVPAGQATGKSYGSSGLPTLVRGSTATTAINTFSSCERSVTISLDLYNTAGVLSSGYRFVLK